MNAGGTHSPGIDPPGTGVRSANPGNATASSSSPSNATASSSSPGNATAGSSSPSSASATGTAAPDGAARAGRLAGGALLVVLGVWGGSKFYAARAPAPNPRGIPVPAGEASAPNPSDLANTEATPEGGSKIPDRLPQFSLADRSGDATSIASFGDKSLVINFWATWCAPCRSEIPLLKSLHSEWAGRDVSVIGIAVDHRDKVLEYATRAKIDYPLLIGEQDALDAAAAFGVAAPVFPFTVFTDRRGEVVALFIGELHRPQAELILGEVQSLNQDLIKLPAARDAIVEGLRALKGG